MERTSDPSPSQPRSASSDGQAAPAPADLGVLRRTEQRYAALVEHASDLILLLDNRGIVRYASPSVDAVLGSSMESIAGTTAFDYVHPDDRPAVVAAFQNRLVDGTPVPAVTFRVRDRQGEWRWLEAGSNVLGEGADREMVIVARDVTAQQTAHAALARSEARFRALASRASDVALMCDAFGRISYVSDAVNGLFGYTREAIEGTVGFDFVHPDDEPFVSEQFAAAVTKPGPHPPFEFRVRIADGSWRWCEERITNLLDDPAVEAVIANLTDVTERREAENALRASEATYRSIVQTAEEGIWIGDSLGRTLFANRKLVEMFGLDPDDVIQGRSALDFLHADDFDKGVDALRLRNQGVSSRTEIRFVRADGSVLWTIVSGAPYYDADGAFVGSLAMITDITVRKEAEQELADRAMRDELTGLPNRRVLLDRVGHALDRRSDETIAVLFIDLDDFKLVNDSFGHAAGDHLLVRVARRLEAAARRGDTVARLGGDEFVVLCEGLDSPDDALVVAERLQDALADPICVGDTTVFATASIGVAVTPASTADELLRNADSAMYLAKGRGEARCALYDDAQQEAAVARLRTIADLRRAVVSDQFVVHYQPIVHLDREVPAGVEALVRWEHPTEGLLAPARFMDEAEATGLIADIGTIVLRRACLDLAQLRRRRPDLRLSVNLSARQLAHGDLTAVVADALDAAGVPAAALTLEVTESSVMEDPEQGLATLRALRELGVSLSLDDFGTGYSSLAYLRTLPVDEVKIDRSFVMTLGEDRTALALVNGIVDLAHAVGMRVVAEGVETADHRDALRRFGCDLGQGFRWSAAVPLADIGTVLDGLTPPPVDLRHPALAG